MWARAPESLHGEREGDQIPNTKHVWELCPQVCVYLYSTCSKSWNAIAEHKHDVQTGLHEYDSSVIEPMYKPIMGQIPFSIEKSLSHRPTLASEPTLARISSLEITSPLARRTERTCQTIIQAMVTNEQRIEEVHEGVGRMLRGKFNVSIITWIEVKPSCRCPTRCPPLMCWNESGLHEICLLFDRIRREQEAEIRSWLGGGIEHHMYLLNNNAPYFEVSLSDSDQRTPRSTVQTMKLIS